jgi:hypothetical protein
MTNSTISSSRTYSVVVIHSTERCNKTALTHSTAAEAVAAAALQQAQQQQLNYS